MKFLEHNFCAFLQQEAVDDELESIEKEINTSSKKIGIHQIITTRQFR